MEGTRSVRAFLRGHLISECSYVAGYAAEFNGADLLGDSLNTMVIVVIQYRLGAFGRPFDSALVSRSDSFNRFPVWKRG